MASRNFEHLCFALLNGALAEQFTFAPLGGPYAMLLYLLCLQTSSTSFMSFFNLYNYPNQELEKIIFFNFFSDE